MPVNRWFYRLFDEEFGPVSPESIRDMLATSSLSESSEIRLLGSPHWQRIGDIPEFLLPQDTQVEAADTLNIDDFIIETEGTSAAVEPPVLWHCRIDRKESGPVEFESLVEWACAGRLKPTDKIRSTRDNEWVLAASVLSLFECARQLRRERESLENPVGFSAFHSDAISSPVEDAVHFEQVEAEPVRGEADDIAPTTGVRSDLLPESELFSASPALEDVDSASESLQHDWDLEADELTQSQRGPVPVWEKYSSLGISAILHVVLALLLGLWIIRSPLSFGDVNTIVLDLADSTRALETTFTTFPAAIVPTDASKGSVESSPISTLISRVPVEASAVTDLLNMEVTEPVLPALPNMEAELTRSDLSEQIGPPAKKRSEEPKIPSVSAVGELSDVARILAGTMEDQVGTGDTLVVWLFDQSQSMQLQHRLLSERLKPAILKLHEEHKEHPQRLMHIAIAYGKDVRESNRPTSKPNEILNAFQDSGVDPSGVENVLSAIQKTIKRYIAKPAYKGRHIHFVIMTDETGDDMQFLEATIQLCQKHQVTVDVIGPSAVLGHSRGYQQFIHPINNLAYYLPVTRGPDCGFPQRINLPYWYRNVAEDWDESVRGPWQGADEGWRGGSNLEGLVSGFAPYALTRLTMETRGHYILFDRPADRSPFHAEELQAYQPDYRAVAEIMHDIQSNPELELRRSVLAAIRVINNSPVALIPPQLAYGGGIYTPGRQFASNLQQLLIRPMAQNRQVLAVLEQALKEMSQQTSDLEEAYAAEASPRWRAWFDLTYGRLLAAYVRHQEFLLVSQAFVRSGAILPDTNVVAFTPHDVITGTPLVRDMAVKSSFHLQRCVREHPGTPWHHLADRELQHPLGIFPTQTFAARPPTQVAAPTSRGPQPKLPSL